MPKLKDMTIEEYLTGRFDENADGLQSQFDACGKSHEFMAGWLTAVLNRDVNYFWRLTFGKEHERDKQQEIIRKAAREFVAKLK